MNILDSIRFADLPDVSAITTEAAHPRARDLCSSNTLVALDAMDDLELEVFLALRKARASIAGVIDAATPRLRTGGAVYYFGAGTSGRLGVLDASEVPPTFNLDDQFIGLIAGGDRALRHSTERTEDSVEAAEIDLSTAGIDGNDVVIGITASGRTPYVLGGLEWVYNQVPGALTVLLSCNDCESTPWVDHHISAPVGEEFPAGSTRMKSGSVTKLILNRISTLLCMRLGRIFRGRMIAVRPSNAKLVARATGLICEFSDLSPEGAFELLTESGGEVPVALVMLHLDKDRDEALKALEEQGYDLESLIGAKV